MPVRDSSEWRHAIIQKKAINLDHGMNGGPTKYVMCAWDTCEKDGYEMYKVIQETGAVYRGAPPRPLSYVFCSERHRQYFLNDRRSYGNPEPGSVSPL